MGPSNFKAIVVGGGPVGLTAAHALDRAGIDFVVLERNPKVIIDAGSNLVLSPAGQRAMAQLGIMAALDDVSTPLDMMSRLDHDGRDIGDMFVFREMKKRTGLAPRVISRRNLIENLYNTLANDAQAKILPGKKLAGLKSTPDGVVATCLDSSSYDGSIVIGADGAHSATRDLMRALPEINDPTEASPEPPFLTTYRCLWIRFPSPPGLGLGITCETHGYKLATQLFTGGDSAVIAVYERLDKSTTERIRHTKADQEALIDRWGHLPLTLVDSLTLQDVYNSRMEAGLVSLEEGVLKKWSIGGRAILVGDAAHKFTPSTGAGCNNGMLDIATLVSELSIALQSTRPIPGEASATPTRDALESAFKAYQEKRHAAVEFECKLSSERTAMATWETENLRHQDEHVVIDPALQTALVERVVQALARAPTFDFLQRQEAPLVKEHMLNSALYAPVAVH